MSRMGAGREWVRGWRFERRRSMVWLLCGRVVVLGRGVEGVWGDLYFGRERW